jgi:hypothetical protein
VDTGGENQLKVVVYPHVSFRCALGDRNDKPTTFEPLGRSRRGRIGGRPRSGPAPMPLGLVTPTRAGMVPQVVRTRAAGRQTKSPGGKS